MKKVKYNNGIAPIVAILVVAILVVGGYVILNQGGFLGSKDEKELFNSDLSSSIIKGGAGLLDESVHTEKNDLLSFKVKINLPKGKWTSDTLSNGWDLYSEGGKDYLHFSSAGPGSAKGMDIRRLVSEEEKRNKDALKLVTKEQREALENILKEAEAEVVEKGFMKLKNGQEVYIKISNPPVGAWESNQSSNGKVVVDMTLVADDVSYNVTAMAPWDNRQSIGASLYTLEISR